MCLKLDRRSDTVDGRKGDESAKEFSRGVLLGWLGCCIGVSLVLKLSLILFTYHLSPPGVYMENEKQSKGLM